MKYLGRKILFLIAVLSVFIPINTAFAASGTPLGTNNGDAVLGFEIYNISNYAPNCSASEVGPAMQAYMQGTLPSSYRLSEGDTVDAGKCLLVITNITLDSGKTITSINYKYKFNSDVLTNVPLGPNPGTVIAGMDYPFESDWMGNKTSKFTVSFAVNNESDGTYMQSTAYDPTISNSLNSHQNLGYYFFKVNDDAAGGTSMPFSYGPQQAMCDASPIGGGRVWLNQNALTIKVSGGSTSSDATLKQIGVSYNGQSFAVDSSTPFNQGVYTDGIYKFVVGNGAADIDFNLIANDSGATITHSTISDINSDIDKFVAEDNSIHSGMNTFQFTVTAADGTVKYYTINVYKLSDDTSVKDGTGITADGITLTKQSDGKTYTGLTTFADTDTTIYVDPTHQNAWASSGAGSWTFTSSGATINTRNVIVSAENCKSEYVSIPENTCATKTYTVNITRSNAASNADLSDLRVGLNGATPTTINGFSKTGYTYNLGDVPNSTNSISIAATLDDTNGQILNGLGNDKTIAVGDNTFEVKTVAQDGTTKRTYTIKVHRKSDEKRLNSLTITSNPAGTWNTAFSNDYTGTYKYSYDPTVSTVKIRAEVFDTGKAKVAVVDATGGQPATYTSTLNAAEATFNVPATTDVSVIVTSENGGVRVFPIQLERQQSNDNYLSGLTVTYEEGGVTKTGTLSPSFGANTRSYTVTIPADVDTVTVTPTKVSTYATIRKIGTQTGTDLTDATISNLQFGNNSIPIVVYSESGNDNPYTLTVVRSKYNIATLDALSLGDGSFTTAFASGTTTYTYNGSIPYSQNTITINGQKTNSYASVQVSVTDEKNNTQSQTITEGDNRTFSGTINLPTGTNTVGILVTAHDNTTKTYTVQITREKNNDSSVSSLIVDGQVTTPTYDDTTHTYTVTVPFNTVTITPAQVAVTPTDTAARVTKGSSVTGLSTTAYKDFTFRVTAEDNTYTDYTVKIIKKQNNAAVLSRETVRIGTKDYYCDVNQSTKSCTISVPVNTETFTMTSTISENATVNPVNGTQKTMLATESSLDIPVTVTSEDETNSEVYVITIERAKSSDNSLQDLQIDGTTVNNFSQSANSFSDVEGGATSSVEVTATVNDVGKATVYEAKVNGVAVTVTGSIENGVYTFTAPLNYGVNNVIITVEAENTQKQNINLSITRQQNETATIGRLDEGVGSATPTQISDWNPQGNTYTLQTVDYNVTSISLIAYPDDSTYGTAKVTRVENENGTATQTNIPNETAVDGQYKATINLSTGTNTITLVGYAHNTSVTKVYTLTIVRTKNSDNSVSDIKVKNVPVTDNGDGTYSVTLANSVSSITAADVTYTLPDGATAVVTPATLNLSTTSDNIVNLTVTSEGGQAVIYPIHITRTKSNNADLTRVSLKIVSDDANYNGKDYYCNFDTTTAVACTIDVPVSTTAYTITSTTADSTATVSPVNGTSDTMSTSESTKVIPITVTAEDNSHKDYTVTVRRAKSSNTNLDHLKINGVSVANFLPDGTLYYFEVDGDTADVMVDVAVEDTGRAIIENADTFQFPVDVGFGNTNSIAILVKAEDGTKKTVNVQVTRLPRTDATLKSIKIDGADILTYDVTPTSDTFDPSVEEYTINTPFAYSKTSINVTAEVNDPDNNASITSGIGNQSLTTGNNNTITIKVTAHDGTTKKEYKIHVSRDKNNDTTIASINLAGNAATFNENDQVWEVTVPNNVTEANQTNLVVTPSPGASTNDALASVAFTNTQLNTATPTDINITVTAEDGTVDNTHVLRVTRTKSSVATLHTLVVDGGSFSPSFVPDDETKLVYNVTVPVTATSIDISATTTEPNAKIITGTGNFALTASTQTYDIHVQSEDETKNVHYTLKVSRTQSSDNTIKVITVKNNDTVYDVYNYDTNVQVTEGNYGTATHFKVTIPGDIETVNIDAKANDTRATVDQTNLGDKTIPAGTSRNYTIKITSESGAANTYTLTIEREKKSNNNLSSLKVDNVTVPNFDPDTLDYYLDEVENDIATVVINAEAEDTDATILSGTGTQNLDTGDNDIEVVVKAQNGDLKTYTIHIHRKQSTDNRLSLLSINGYPLSPTYAYVAPPTEETHEYAVTLRYNKGTFGADDINAMPHNNTANVTFDEDITLDTGETKSFNIYVTSESGSLNTYTIRVTRAKSDNALLDNVVVKVGDGEDKFATISPSFNPETYEYDVSIPYGETKYTIIGTAQVDSTMIIGNNVEYLVSDTNEITLVTYAETYKVDGTEAEQNATKTYKFNIIQAQSNNAYLASLSVDGYEFQAPHTEYSQAYTNYDIGDIESDITGLRVNAVAENTNSTITYRVNTEQPQTNNVVALPNGVGRGTITITVTAPDGLTKMTYTITYNKVYGSNAYLMSLTTNKGSISPAFIKTNRDYVISVGADVETLDLTFYTEKRSSNVSINGGTPVSGTDFSPYTYTVENLSTGDTAITLLVTAENNTTALTYNIVIRKALPVSAGDATLSSLSVDGYPFLNEGTYSSTFSKDVENYSIGQIPFKTDKLKVIYATTQGTSHASLLVNGVAATADSDGYVTIPKANATDAIVTVLVTAANGDTKTYNIHYRKNASSDASLSNLVVSTGSLNPAFTPNVLEYDVTVPDGTTSLSITATLNDPNATLTVGGVNRTSPYIHTLTNLGNGNVRVTFLVTAEDGTIREYYVNVKDNSGKELITSAVHQIETRTNKLVKTVKVGTTIGDLLTNEIDNDKSKLSVWTEDGVTQLSDSDYVATGQLIKLVVNGELNDTARIVVRGDVNGDGEIDLADSVKIINHYLEKPGADITVDYNFVAADINEDTELDLADSVAIINDYLGKPGQSIHGLF